MKKYTLLQGKGQIDFELENNLIYPESGQNNMEANTPEEALASPIGSKSLAELARDVDKVAVIVPDATRDWQNVRQMSFLLRSSLEKVQSCDWIIGGGLHRPPTDQEVNSLLGSAAREEDRIHFHDPSIYVDTGLKTSRGNPITLHKAVYEADLVVFAGGIVHHDLAGFSGGRKSLMPGVSGKESIIFNHSLCLEGRGINNATGGGKLKDNPANEDMIEYARIALEGKKAFILNVVPDQKGKPYCYFAGDLFEAWGKGTEAARELQVLKVDEKVDFALVSPGGYPCDIDLYQSTKAISAVQGAVKEGGPIIMAAGLEDGMGPGDFDGMVNRSMNNVDDVLKELQSNFTIPGFIAFKLVMDGVKNPLKLVTQADNITFPGEIYSSMEEALRSLGGLTERDKKGLILSAGNCVTVKTDS